MQKHSATPNAFPFLHSAFCLLHFLNSPALRNVVKTSFSTSANGLPTIEARATNTRSIGCKKSCWCTRKASRSSRRARLRMMALPSLPLVTTPSREIASGGSLRQLAIRQPQTSRWPSWRTREKSRPCLMRIARPNFSLGASAGMADYTGVRRLRPWRRRLRNVARPLLLRFRARNPCCRTRRRLDG